MLEQLNHYLGQNIEHDGKRCQLIEILEVGPMLVFLCPDEDSSIQSNQHGDATRRSPNTYSVPLISANGEELHPVARAVIPKQLHAELLAHFRNSE